MQYRKNRYGEALSLLGYGCMRLTRKGGSIDIEKAESEIMAAFKAGVNYFDTAYLYPGNEMALGQILEKNGIREQVHIATKLPHYLILKSSGIDRLFDEQIRRLRTSYVDYYLMHMLTDVAEWERLKSLGILDWIAEKKRTGVIRNIGFSYHGNTDNFLKILYNYDWDFCQIQYNYLDESTQAGVKGLEAAAAKGIPVIIMEPLRGGKLVNLLPEEAKDAMARSGRGWTPAEWAFRWLYNQPAVTVVLSGMNSLKMIEENVATASEAAAGAFTKEDHAVIEQVRELIRKTERVGCTGCRYCMPCPRGVDIPGVFRSYNAMYAETKWSGRWQYFQNVAMTKEPTFASQCIGCGKCESHCPQGIPIREKLKEADRALRPLPYRLGIALARKFILR
ncbi:MAG: aldo/keto reductase [Bacteroidales bacterium]|nr:aldo/keto reductase [Bacteroidales bacterium]